MISDEGDALVTLVEQMRRSEFPTADVVDDHTRKLRMCDVQQHRRLAVAAQRLDLVVEHRQRDHQQAGHAAAADEVAHRVRALLGRLDVEQQQVIAQAVVAAEPADHPAQALDHRVRGEERHHDADRLGLPDRERARTRIEPVAELVDRRTYACAGLFDHERAVVEDARNGGRAHAGQPGDIANRGTAAP